MPQDAVEVFVTAHECMGHLGATLPDMRGEITSSVHQALLACGDLVYWAARRHEQSPQTSAQTLKARSILVNLASTASAGAIYLVTSARIWDRSARRSLIDQYPELIVQVCRKALGTLQDQVFYYDSGIRAVDVDVAVFCIQVLGEFGDGDDLPAIRALSDDVDYGVEALNAIKKLEARVNFR